MKDISIYFSPITALEAANEHDLSNEIVVHDESGFPEIDGKGIAILHVPEYRNSTNSVSGESLGYFQELAKLHCGDGWDFNIYALGTIKPGEKIEDTYFAVGQVVSELVKQDVLPVIIGGSNDLTMACYKAFEHLERTINICAVDNRLDVGNPEERISSTGYVSHLLLQRPCYLFNYSNIGLQRPLVSKRELQLFEKLYFDVCRLGEFNADFKKAEPHLRNSDLITIDLNAIKGNELDPSKYEEVNGLKSDQICQIAKYAGMSDKLSCLGIFELKFGHSRRADSLIAQMIWYFMDGFALRVGDFPIGSKRNYTRFNVHLDDFEDDLVFYKSDKSGRWWLEVSYPAGEGGKYERHHLIPCDREDYDKALENVIPNLWWKTLQKLS
jgi:arginase family enzyme